MKTFFTKSLAIILFLGIQMCFNSKAQVSKRIYYADENSVPTAHPMDFEHLKLEVSFEPKAGKVIGNVTHDFSVLYSEIDTVFLHGPDIKIKSASLDGEAIVYIRRSDGYAFRFGKTLRSGEKHQMILSYEALPKKGMYFIGWNDETNRSRKQIWTQGQGRDNRHWIPMYDMPNDKVTTELIVHMEEGYSVLSNGSLLSKKKNKDGTYRWHYRMKKPHATYLIMLGIGKYEVKSTKTDNGVPMNFYYYPDWENRVSSTYKYSEDMMRFMEEETWIPYPWPSYSQIPVQDFLYGAMENTSATIFGDFFFVDERSYLDKNYVRVNAHELAHQWFGDYVTARTSTHHWLQESFATHYDLRYQKEAFGEDHFHWARRQAALTALNASEKDLKPLAHSSAGTARHYPKGSYVLQMLRDVAGEDNYKKAINYYLKKHAYGNVDTRDLLVAFHESTGLSLDWFWEEWIYKGGEPHFKVEFESSHRGETHYGRFIIEQIQPVNELTGYFKMPIELQVHFEDGSMVEEVVFIENQHHIIDFEIPGHKDVSYVLFDAGSKILKKVDFKLPFNYYLHQASKAENVLDRYDAVRALESTPIEIKRSIFRSIFNDLEFHAVRSEVFRQLMNDPGSKDLWALALKDKDVEVRKTALRSISLVNDDMLPTFKNLLNDSSYSVIEMTLQKLHNQYEGSEKVNEYLEMTKDVVGNNESNVRMTWLQIDYYENSNQESLAKLIDFTSPSYEFRTRVKAAQKLMELNYLDEVLLSNILDGLFSWNPRLRGPMKDILDQYYSSLDHRKLIKAEVSKGQWNDWQRKRLKMVLK